VLYYEMDFAPWRQYRNSNLMMDQVLKAFACQSSDHVEEEERKSWQPWTRNLRQAKALAASAQETPSSAAQCLQLQTG
jgi:hypothetical protein